jgi:hypothetical protein
MSLSSASKAVIMALFTLWTAGSARAADDTKGKAAAHAALEEKADVPATPPHLPDAASDRARAAVGGGGAGTRGEAARKAHAQGQRNAGDDDRAAHADAANRAAEGSVAAAAKNANADSHAAAGQARAAAARAKPHPNN